MNSKTRHSKSLVGILALIFLLLLLATFLVGSYLTKASSRSVGEAPVDLEASAIEFEGLSGWFVPAEGPHCILLMHSVRSNRKNMIGRARFLKQHGYSSLLFDFQAHGESPGEMISFGLLESENALAALKYLNSTGQCEKVAALGVSLGGAAALMGRKPLAVDALVLESVFATIEDAIANRLEIRLGKIGRLFAPLLYRQIPWRADTSLEAYNIVESIKRIQSPVFVLSGLEDEHTKISEARELFKNAPNPKRMWEVPDATHDDLYVQSGQEYERRVLAFLSEFL